MALVGSPLGWLFEFVLGLVGLALYFLPTIIAATRNTTKLAAVVLVNLLLGWSVIGWVVALVMSMTLPPKPRY
jgi:NAD/NADP transhydrogenase beta subunit